MGITPGQWAHYSVQFATRPLAAHRALIREASVRYGKYGKVSVLDFGCGEGIFSGVFRRNIYVGIDKNIGNLCFARMVYKVDMLAAGNEQLCFKDKVFDCILLNNVLHHMGEKEIFKVFLEVRRILKDRGILIIMELLPPDKQKGFFLRLVTYIEERLKKINYFDKDQIQGLVLLEDRIEGSYNFMVYRP